jgi:type I restriction enzyme S subunit
MRHIKRSALAEVKTAVPSDEIMTEFARRVEPIHGQSIALRQLSVKLEAIRGLLLPRLVSGQLDISDVDLGVLAPAEDE